jgi:hypothetical protein
MVDELPLEDAIWLFIGFVLSLFRIKHRLGIRNERSRRIFTYIDSLDTCRFSILNFVRKRGSVAHRKQLTRLEYQISLSSCSGTVVQIPSAKVPNLAGMSLCRERFRSDVGTPLRSMLQSPHDLRRAMLSSKTKQNHWMLISLQLKLPHNILREQ